MRLSPILVSCASTLTLALIACAPEAPPAGSKSTAAKTDPSPTKGAGSGGGEASSGGGAACASDSQCEEKPDEKD